MTTRLGAVTLAVLPAIAVGTGVAALVRDDGRELLQAVAVVPPANTDPEARGETTAPRAPLRSVAAQRPVELRPAVALRRVEAGRSAARARTRPPAPRHRATPRHHARRVAEVPPAAVTAPPAAVVAQAASAAQPPATVVAKPAPARPAPAKRPHKPRPPPPRQADEPAPEPAAATTDPWDLVVAWAEDAAGMEDDADGEDD